MNTILIEWYRINIPNIQAYYASADNQGTFLGIQASQLIKIYIPQERIQEYITELDNLHTEPVPV